VKRFTSWLESKLSRPKSPAVITPPKVREIVKSKDSPNDDYVVESSFDAKVPGRIETHEPGKNVLMPDIYGNRTDPTEPDLKILDKSSPDVDISTGFNPYDTVVLHTKPGSKKR
jgi:hypothetical protein